MWPQSWCLPFVPTWLLADDFTCGLVKMRTVSWNLPPTHLGELCRTPLGWWTVSSKRAIRRAWEEALQGSSDRGGVFAGRELCQSLCLFVWQDTPAGQLKEAGVDQLIVWGYSSSWRGRHGSWGWRQLVTPHPQSKGREQWMLVGIPLSPFIQCGTSACVMMPSTVRANPP